MGLIMAHSTGTLSFPLLAGTVRVLERFSPSSILLSVKPLPALPTSLGVSSLKFQERKSPIPAQVKFAASQALAVALAGLVVTIYE